MYVEADSTQQDCNTHNHTKQKNTRDSAKNRGCKMDNFTTGLTHD